MMMGRVLPGKGRITAISSARMEFLVHLFQGTAGHVRVNLRCGDIQMTQ